MLLAHLDESYTKERYFIAAVLVPDGSARPLTQALDRIVTETSEDHPDLSSRAELHGYDIVAGKADWECLAPRVRVRIGVSTRHSKLWPLTTCGSSSAASTSSASTVGTRTATTTRTPS
ncbi:MAG: hypothetical protein ACRCYR_11985 [Phycicoccus sp.]